MQGCDIVLYLLQTPFKGHEQNELYKSILRGHLYFPLNMDPNVVHFLLSVSEIAIISHNSLLLVAIDNSS